MITDIACFDNNSIRGKMSLMLLQCDTKVFSHLGKQVFNLSEKPGASTSCKLIDSIKYV